MGPNDAWGHLLRDPEMGDRIARARPRIRHMPAPRRMNKVRRIPSRMVIKRAIQGISYLVQAAPYLRIPCVHAIRIKRASSLPLYCSFITRCRGLASRMRLTPRCNASRTNGRGEPRRGYGAAEARSEPDRRGGGMTRRRGIPDTRAGAHGWRPRAGRIAHWSSSLSGSGRDSRQL